MQYRMLGSTGLKVSSLAMGCMRLPENDPDLSAQVVDKCIELGVNYFETTRGYIRGRCQHLTAGGLKGRSRGLIVSGKAGISEETTADSYRREIDLQMSILNVDYLEFFQVGWFSLDRLGMLTRKGGALEALDKARTEGIIGHIGFTGHDTPENFTKLVETRIFDSLTVPYSLLDLRYSQTIRRAGELGVGVIAMCPLAGGILSAPSPQLQELIPGGAKTTADAALRFVLGNPAVSCACSGMNTVEMVYQNVETANAFTGVKNYAEMEKIMNELKSLGDKFCTGCGYCMECPSGVDIPGNFRLYNLAQVYGLSGWAPDQYRKMESPKRADACIKCGVCEPKCPHSLPIIRQLEQVNKYFLQSHPAG